MGSCVYLRVKPDDETRTTAKLISRRTKITLILILMYPTLLLEQAAMNRKRMTSRL